LRNLFLVSRKAKMIRNLFFLFLILCKANGQYYYYDDLNSTKNDQSNYINPQTETNLYADLLKSYNSYQRPSPRVKMSMRISMRQLASIDPLSQVMTTNFYLSSSWNDDRLKWNNFSYDNITDIILPAESIWTPDLMVLYSADGDGFLQIKNKNLLIAVKSDGLVNLIVSLINLKTKCKLNFYYYPYDKVNRIYSKLMIKEFINLKSNIQFNLKAKLFDNNRLMAI